MTKSRFLMFALGLWLGAVTSVQAQYELKAGNFNRISAAGAPTVPVPPPELTDGQFAGVGMVAGSAGPISAVSTLRLRYPATPVPGQPAVDTPIVLIRASFGGAFSSGVPRFSMGDVITPPTLQVNGVTPAGPAYWRAKPLMPGELLPSLAQHVVVVSSSNLSNVVNVTHVPPSLVFGSSMLGSTVLSTTDTTVTLSGNANENINAAKEVSYVPPDPQSLFPLKDVTVTSASTTSRLVIVTGTLPDTLIPGSTLLGQPIVSVVGNTVTLAGDANLAITGPTQQRITQATSFYYSPHAEKVFASQPGKVSITWVTQAPTAIGAYEYKTEDFSVSSTSSVPTRTIFWTEGSFDGPKVRIDDARITGVNPIFYSAVPKAVAEEVKIPGRSTLTANLSTLSFDRFNGVGLIHAYNVEGRIMIEYLGNLRLGTDIYEHLGFDIVDIERVPAVSYSTVYLGDKIVPHDNNLDLMPSAVLNGAQEAVNYFATAPQADGTPVYYAERETSPVNDPDDGKPATTDAYNKVAFYWLEAGRFGIKWPTFQDRYWLRWSPDLSTYAHYTVSDGGSSTDTGIAFNTGVMPEIIFQDDPTQTEARIDPNTQRFYVVFDTSPDMKNRALLKFTDDGNVWYKGVYTQSESRKITKRTTVATVNGTTTVTVPKTDQLEVGMVVTGPGITGTVIITRIVNETEIVLSQPIPDGTNEFVFTVEPDSQPPIRTTQLVGHRILPPSDHEDAGFISKGESYYPAGYLNPFSVGVAAATKGAIIPVNAINDGELPVKNMLTVRWFKKISHDKKKFDDFYVPGKVGRYTLQYDANSPKLVIAQSVGTGDLDVPKASGSVYYQNDKKLPGYNPNEEHALMLGGRAYALREDLNVTSGSGYTSEPYLLLAYKDPVDDRPAMATYRVVREFDANNNGINDPGDIMFEYSATAGTLLVKPYPLPLMPLALVGSGASLQAKDLEIYEVRDNPMNTSFSGDALYKGFTFKDRKGFTWVHRGPHASPAVSPKISMKLYYPSRPGFFVPGAPGGGEVPPNTILPFLRKPDRSGQPLKLDDIEFDGGDQPLTVRYVPTWPSNPPELRIGETLTLPKFGLPQVRGQTSAQVIYDQSMANDATNSFLKNCVTLHDPTREKTVALDNPSVGLTGIPAAIKTTNYRGKTYFQTLPPHLQQRIFVDPIRGAKGTLVFQGNFHDEIAGEDYLDLNVLTASELEALKALVPTGNGDKAKWDAAITALNTAVETFIPDPAKFGSYKVDKSQTRNVGEDSLATISNPNTAVDSYALTATGQGAGYVTLVFGNGNAFTPEGDPVQVKVIKVAKQLYVGDLKVVQSSNPLDEQVTLRHSGDFAAKPEDYEFDWRWATGEASAPTTYSTTMKARIGNPAVADSQQWFIVRDPGTVIPTEVQYASAAVPQLAPRTAENVHPVTYVKDALNRPTNVVDETSSYTDAEIAAGYPVMVWKSVTGVDFTPSGLGAPGVPGQIVFSADVGDFDGFVLYVNRKAILAYNAPDSGMELINATTGLTPNGLSKQFSLPPGYFTAGPNNIEVAVFSSADPNTLSTLNFKLEAAEETDVITNGNSLWSPPNVNGINTNLAIVGGSPTNPFGGSSFVLNDRWFTLRYRPKLSSSNVLTAGKATQNDVEWSRWLPPQFVEGWVKRVLASINPFEQRVKDLYNNQANTDVSVLTQAGTRWEGDIALTMGGINDVGLIAIYETVLNRAKSMSIDANTNDPDTNNALLLAAGYLNDLYTLLGNEAYADAANPTVSLDDQTTLTEVSTSRFSFEGQVASSLDEELALLRGRTDLVSPGVRTAPAYNRLYWNYTRGINSGEVIYAVNYNIKEKVGSSTANGVIDESDAQRMFPQGHGDAYGHYLTALTGYYRLLTHENFDWIPRAEVVTVLGQPVTVDFMDERKFAAAAGNVARAAQQICELTYRQRYQDNPAAGWESLRDTSSANSQTGVASSQGLDEWVSRSAQGALFHWVVSNALVPEVDPYHTGIQKIDRTTVPEINELVSAGESFQTTIDNANAHLNPLGLNPDSIAFDLSPSELKAGKSHFEQINSRALNSLLNAAGAFNQASRMTRSLRNQQNQIDDYNTSIEAQERAYLNQLIDIYGTPYFGDIGAGKLYAQGYAGPDLEHWFIVDRPTQLVDLDKPLVVTILQPKNINDFTGAPLDDLQKHPYNYIVRQPATEPTTVKIQPSQFAQYSDVWATNLGNRAETGLLQNALLDVQQSQIFIAEARGRATRDRANSEEKLRALNIAIENYTSGREASIATREKILGLKVLQKVLAKVADKLKAMDDIFIKAAEAIAEGMPKVVGVSSDATSPARAAALTVGNSSSSLAKFGAMAADFASKAAEMKISGEEKDLDMKLREYGFNTEAVQLAYEFNMAYRDAVSHTETMAGLALTHQRALQNVLNVLAKGNRVLSEREIFRQRAAAIIQGYRTKDLTFRMFRNEALEQYRSLFDLAGRYTYLAAKSYDYETGLLGSNAGQQVFDDIVAARALGDLTDGKPQSTTGSHGDGGLAAVMAKLNADFSVAEGRLGINNPDQNGTVFSLRGELYRIQTPGSSVSADDAWRQTLEQHVVSNLMSDADVATQCRNLKKPDGSSVPGIILPFNTTIEHGKNFFGLDLAAYDHNYSPSSFATKIYSVGIAMPGYVGMDPYATGSVAATPPTTNSPNALSATPYVYLIPCGLDSMLAPAFGDTNTVRSWMVRDQALPLPYNLGATSFNSSQFFDANGTLTEQPWIIRKHQAFRPVSDASFFYSLVPTEFTNSRLVGRSVWNTQWKIVIPAYTLLNNEQEGLNRFAASVKDIQIFLRTYSHSGN